MALKSRTSFPPGAFIFYQPETGWTSPPHIGFSPTVDAIIAHRKANPRFKLSLDRATVESELDGYTSARLQSTYGDAANEWISGAAAPPVFTRPRPSPRVERGAVAVVNKAVAGIGLLIDFLGPKLTPVNNALASRRGEICAGCKLNQPGTALEEAGGKALHLLLEYKADKRLNTIWDDRLLYCSVCSCNLKLKVHVPLDYVISKTTPEQMEKLDPRCWIKLHDST